MHSFFKTTHLLSSNQITVIVADYGNRNNSNFKTENEMLQRAFIPTDMQDRADHALNFSIAALQQLEDFTGFYYENEKLDSVMVPSDEGAGGSL
jgi:aminopeptidase N